MNMITIIIPVYNVEAYIEKCLSSVMQQTYQGAMECILVDDCGSDKSIKIAEELLHKYTGNIQFKIVHHDCNRGLSAARNTGIKNASGDWIYFLDSDDYIISDCIELLVVKAQEYPIAQMVQGGAVTNHGSPVQVDMESDSPKIVDYMDNKLSIKKGILHNNTCYACNAWNKLIKTDFIRKHHLFFKEGIIYEDAYWQFFVAKHLTSVAFLRKNTYNYNIRENSISHSHGIFNDKNFESWYIMATDFINNIDEECFNEQVLRALEISVPMYRSCKDKSHSKLFKDIINDLANKCNHRMRQRILFLLALPKRIFYIRRVFLYLCSNRFIK